MDIWVLLSGASTVASILGFLWVLIKDRRLATGTLGIVAMVLAGFTVFLAKEREENRAIENRACMVLKQLPPDEPFKSDLDHVAQYRAVAIAAKGFLEKHQDRFPQAYKDALGLAKDAGQLTSDRNEPDRLYQAAVAMKKLIRIYVRSEPC